MRIVSQISLISCLFFSLGILPSLLVSPKPDTMTIGEPLLTATPAAGSTVFEDFSNGIASWTLQGSVGSAQDNGNTFLQFTPPAQSAAEASRGTAGVSLAPYSSIQIDINLHSATLEDDTASAFYLNQGGSWKYVSLSHYVTQGATSWQTITVPLADFVGTDGVRFDKTAAFDSLGFRFWMPAAGATIDIDNIVFTGAPGSAVSTAMPSTTERAASTTSPTDTPVAHTAMPTGTPTRTIRSIRTTASKSHQRRTPSIPLTITLRPSRVVSGGILTVRIRTIAHARVSITIFVAMQKAVSAGKNHKPATRTSMLYRATFHGVADAHGQLVDRIQITYRPSRPIKASVVGQVTVSHGTTNHTITLMILPSTVRRQLSPVPHHPPTSKTALRWSIQSVDSMKVTRDRICNPVTVSWINRWLAKAVELGANYVTVDTPYDSPTCGNALAYTATWVRLIHAKGMHVWYRQVPLAWEGIYGRQKNTAVDYIGLIVRYIKQNGSLYRPGDIFTPIPEPQMGGIVGANCNPNQTCQFASPHRFNVWLRTAMTASRRAFQTIGVQGMKIGYFGFDGFITWGDNNPDWRGRSFLESQTVKEMGNITIDHYPQGTTMAQDLAELHKVWPGVHIVIGEWGTKTAQTGARAVSQVQAVMGAAASDPEVVGFNYWHLGSPDNPAPKEALINSDFSDREQFHTVQSFYKH